MIPHNDRMSIWSGLLTYTTEGFKNLRESLNQKHPTGEPTERDDSPAGTLSTVQQITNLEEGVRILVSNNLCGTVTELTATQRVSIVKGACSKARSFPSFDATKYATHKAIEEGIALCKKKLADNASMKAAMEEGLREADPLLPAIPPVEKNEQLIWIAALTVVIGFSFQPFIANIVQDNILALPLALGCGMAIAAAFVFTSLAEETSAAAGLPSTIALSLAIFGLRLIGGGTFIAGAVFALIDFALLNAIDRRGQPRRQRCAERRKAQDQQQPLLDQVSRGEQEMKVVTAHLAKLEKEKSDIDAFAIDAQGMAGRLMAVAEQSIEFALLQNLSAKNGTHAVSIVKRIRREQNPPNPGLVN